MNIDVQTLRWYAAVAQQLHFARAAQSLGISRIRLSKTVVELEELLGVDLFVPGASPHAQGLFLQCLGVSGKAQQIFHSKSNTARAAHVSQSPYVTVPDSATSCDKT